MGFLETRFPVAISYGLTGGPERRTEVVTLGSGREERNSPWAQSRRRWNAVWGIREAEELAPVVNLFEAARGRLYGFRFLDPLDHRSCGYGETVTAVDQVIGEGDGVATSFNLVKGYGAGEAITSRRILKPVPGTLLIAVDGAAQTEGTHFWCDYLSGTVAFAAAPTGTVTAGFHFDVPVRFDTDALDLNAATIDAGEIPNIPLRELLGISSADTVPVLLEAATSNGAGAAYAWAEASATLWTWGTFGGAVLVFEDSANGSDWSTVETFTGPGARTVATDRPWLRARVASAGGSTSINAHVSSL